MHVSVLEIWQLMNCDHFTIVRHSHSMGKFKKSGVWVLHALSQNYKNQRLAICAAQLARHRLACEQHRPFLSSILTGDEKRCLYANVRKRKEWLNLKKKATPRMRTCAHPQKIMLCIWWNSEGVLYYELLPRGNHRCWHLLSTIIETSCRRNPRKTTNETAWSDTTPR